MIPVSTVTGFLGCGKTTLISRVLREPRFSRTAVIVNEFGEIGLDHELVARGDESVLELTTGCLCCAVQTDLVRTLLGLLARREAGDIRYERVLIETSGLADPSPILHALMIDRQIAASHSIAAVVTLVDVMHGEASIRNHPEARRQIALADRLLLSKTDVAPASGALLDRLRGLNPGVPIVATSVFDPADLFIGGTLELLTQRMAALPREGRARLFNRALHTPEVATLLLVRDRPVPAIALTLLLQALAEHGGDRLLRVKGLVAIEEVPGRPALIHGVRHVFAAPNFLDRWPGDDMRTRVVLITMGMPRYFPARLLDAIESEVREETAFRAE